MTRLLFLAVLSYLDSSGDPLKCEVVVVCDPGAQSCHAHPIEVCAGSYDPKKGELKGKWNMGQCLTAELVIGSERIDVLGCSPDRTAMDVDADAVRKAGGK